LLEKNPMRHPRLTPLFLLLLTGCAATAATTEPSSTPAKQDPLEALRAAVKGFGERGGLVLADEGYGDGATKLVYLDQGWNPAETLWFYHADQGSVLMPYDVLVHVEQVGSQRPFIAPENLTRYRFLNQHRTPNNPDALPVGFSRHDDKVGLTCAACHTSQVNYHGTAIRIDGAPALADITRFFTDLDAAIAATLADEARLQRFAAALPGGGKDEAHLASAKKSLGSTHAWFTSYLAANHSSTAEGFGRLDAIGRIINQVIRFTSDPKNSLEPNAPTSFPLLWDAPRHDYVQWTGFAPNASVGSLGRNTGEVVGVFGNVEVKHYETEDEAKKGYPSSVEAMAIAAMEESLYGLRSPVWPEDHLPKIDRALAARGEGIYKAQCQSCHALIDRADPFRHVTAMITGIDVVKTDDTSASNLLKAHAPTGILQGAISPKGVKYGADAGALDLLGDLVTRVLSTNPPAAVRALADSKLHHLEETKKQGNHTEPTAANPTADIFSYKARPLNGIWATAPYLHNGSVPTLHDLLLPPAKRPKTFTVGRLEFDPKKVGRLSDGTVPFVFDTTVTGNSNRGHEYGTALGDDDRWALVEYLKTL
jgi:cytochrome c5